MPFFAIALMIGGCGGDDPPAGGSGGSGGSRTGGSGGGGGRGGAGGMTASGGSTGSGGSTASGGSTGSGGSTAGDAGDAGEVRETGGETGGDTSSDRPAETGAEAGGGDTSSADICSAYVAGSGSLAGIAAADFCAKYSSVCTFGGTGRYTDMADCMTKYAAVGTAAKTCRAGHLCNAAMPGGVGTHCPHATGMQVAACVGP
ncbi:MAG TPA: hypothetical protein VGG33_09990 [Polyangia bacterium]